MSLKPVAVEPEIERQYLRFRVRGEDDEFQPVRSGINAVAETCRIDDGLNMCEAALEVVKFWRSLRNW